MWFHDRACSGGAFDSTSEGARSSGEHRQRDRPRPEKKIMSRWADLGVEVAVRLSICENLLRSNARRRKGWSSASVEKLNWRRNARSLPSRKNCAAAYERPVTLARHRAGSRSDSARRFDSGYESYERQAICQSGSDHSPRRAGANSVAKAGIRKPPCACS